MTSSQLRFLATGFAMVAACVCAEGQIMIDAFAGGVVRSGVSAQNVAFGIISGITRGPKGNLVFCDSSTHVIRRINADGTIETIAGKGIPDYGGDGEAAKSALLNYPKLAKYDGTGNLYFVDTNNYRIRRIDASGTITTVAGTGIRAGSNGPLGADGPAAQSQIGYVSDMAIDSAGYVDFIDDFAQVRRLTPAGKIEAYATACSSNGCRSLAADSTGNLYVSDGSRIYRISSDGTVHNLAGLW